MILGIRGRFVVWVGLAALTLSMVGCKGSWFWKAWIDPTKNIDAGDESEMRPILMAIDPMDEHQETFPNAEPPKPEDLTWSDEDYLLGPGDAVDIAILDLYAEGAETRLQRVISNEGFVKLPLVEQRVQLRGLTAERARLAVVNLYRPDILLDPTVSVELLAKRQNQVNILGPVLRAGTYPIPRRDFRLLDALTASGDVTQIGIRYIYVFRKTDAVDRLRVGTDATVKKPLTPGTLPVMPGTEGGSGDENNIPPELRSFLPGAKPPVTPVPPVVPPIVPPVTPDRPVSPPIIPPVTPDRPVTPPIAPPVTPVPPVAPPIVPPVTPDRPVSPPVAPPVTPVPPVSPTTKPSDADELRDMMPGTEPDPSTRPAMPAVVRLAELATPVGADADAAVDTAPTGKYDPEDPFGWAQADMSHLARIIAIDLEKLKQGDQRQNIIVRDGDTILIPTVKVGEFYVMGEVPRPGAYSLTGRRVTIKQGLAAAGGLAPLAWPSNSVLIRRIGTDREMRVPLRLDRILSGQDPEILLKPDDVIAVGTHMVAPFLAVMRNAFRMTYGMGFIYDRNFAEKNFGQYNGIGESIRFFR